MPWCDDLRLHLSHEELFDLTLAVTQGHLSLEETIERFEQAAW